MPKLRVPTNVTSKTFSSSGVVVPTAKVVDITATELTDIVQSYNQPSIVSSNLNTGTVIVRMSAKITSITINGNTYAVTNGISAPMSAVDATQYIYEGNKLVSG